MKWPPSPHPSSAWKTQEVARGFWWWRSRNGGRANDLRGRSRRRLGPGGQSGGSENPIGRPEGQTTEPNNHRRLHKQTSPKECSSGHGGQHRQSDAGGGDPTGGGLQLTGIEHMPNPIARDRRNGDRTTDRGQRGPENGGKPEGGEKCNDGKIPASFFLTHGVS